jgi:formate/nitrite transporter FocA (FNT family)
MGIGGLRSQGYIAISILPLVLGIILGIACIILLVLAILSKKDAIPSIATKVIFIIFGVIFILLPWIEFLVENLNMIPVLIQAGLPPEVTGSPMFPIPIGSILFLVAGIFAIIGGAKA